MKFAIFETKLAKLSIYSPKVLFINLTNDKGSYTLKNIESLPDIRIFDKLFLYNTLQQCLGIEVKSLYDQIDSKLIKKTWQTAMIDKEDCTFVSGLQFRKDKEPSYTFKNIFEIP